MYLNLRNFNSVYVHHIRIRERNKNYFEMNFIQGQTEQNDDKSSFRKWVVQTIWI